MSFENREDFNDSVFDIEGLCVQPKHASQNLRQVKHVVHLVQKHFALVSDLSQDLQLVRKPLHFVHEYLCLVTNDAQRVAHLVVDRGGDHFPELFRKGLTQFFHVSCLVFQGHDYVRSLLECDAFYRQLDDQGDKRSILLTAASVSTISAASVSTISAASVSSVAAASVSSIGAASTSAQGNETATSTSTTAVYVSHFIRLYLVQADSGMIGALRTAVLEAF